MKWLRCISAYIVFFSFISCKPLRLSQVDAQYTKVQAESGIDSSLYRYVEKYKLQLDEKMDQVISSIPEDLTLSKPSSGLGNMMVDVLYDFYKEKGESIDLAITNQGGVRMNSLSKGSLYMRDAFQLMPFDNEVVLLDISGKILKQFIQHICKQGGWPVSHVQIAVDSSMNILQVSLDHGVSIEDDKIYKLATTDYIANGGDYCNFLVNVPQEKSGVLYRDAIIESWKKHPEGITVDQQKRIYVRQ